MARKFSMFDNTGSANWTKLPLFPINYPGTTTSGGTFVIARSTPDGQFYLVVSDRRTVHISVGEPVIMILLHTRVTSIVSG